MVSNQAFPEIPDSAGRIRLGLFHCRHGFFRHPVQQRQQHRPFVRVELLQQQAVPLLHEFADPGQNLFRLFRGIHPQHPAVIRIGFPPDESTLLQSAELPGDVAFVDADVTGQLILGNTRPFADVKDIGVLPSVQAFDFFAAIPPRTAVYPADILHEGIHVSTSP